MSNLYAEDGLCHNANAGTYGHECGAAATWLGTDRKGFTMGFCDRCKAGGTEARDVVTWNKLASSHRYIPRFRPAGYGTLPGGVAWEYVEWPNMMGFGRADIPMSRHTYGIIATDRALTAQEMRTFDLDVA